MDLLGEGGLGDVETPGGPGESEFLGDGDEIAQVAQLHLAPLVNFDLLYYTTIVAYNNCSGTWFGTARCPSNPSSSTSPRLRRSCTSARCRCAAGPTPAGCPASASAGGGSGASAAPICWRFWSGAASPSGRPRAQGTCAGCIRGWRGGGGGPRPFWRRGWRQALSPFLPREGGGARPAFGGPPATGPRRGPPPGAGGSSSRSTPPPRRHSSSTGRRGSPAPRAPARESCALRATSRVGRSAAAARSMMCSPTSASTERYRGASA